MKRAVKITLKIILAIVLALLIAVIGYLGYLLLSYNRIPDNQNLSISLANDYYDIEAGESYSILTQNIGFGAYTDKFTFFMDGGEESRARSKKSVINCVTKEAEKAAEYDPDFILFQEVDTDSTRSYHVNQKELLESYFMTHNNTFAINYHSAYLMYPFLEPHGASNSGMMTLSRYYIASATRRSLPISKSLSKFLDLDRCYSITRVPVANGKELLIYNVHLSAYGSSDEIRNAQMTMLFEDIEAEYNKGNYIVCGGDFNHDFTGDSTQKLNGGETVDFGWAQSFPEALLPDCLKRCIDYEEYNPTCRNCDIPYEEGNFTIIVDGFLVTDNIKVTKTENISTDFEYSDHNPVYMEFSLK